jgi:hypothetical protein
MNRILACLIVSVILRLLQSNEVVAQNNVGIGTNTPNASALLELLATDKGLLVPRVALTATNAAGPITAPATALLVYNTATAGAAPNNVTPGYYYWGGASWIRFMNGNGTAWITTGNAGTNPTNNFLGTTDNQSLVFRTNNTERMRIRENGFIGIGVINPTVHINYNKNQAVNDWQTMWDNTLNTDALARFQNTNTANGNRVLMGTTNYNANAFAASAIIGLHLNNAGNGGIGVEGFSNSTAATGVLAGFTGGTSLAALGWALFSNGWAGGTTGWLNVSDARIKKNVKTIPSAIDLVTKLRGVSFNYDLSQYPSLNLDEQTTQLGFIAQEIEAVIPSAVKNSNIPATKKSSTTYFLEEKGNVQLKAVSYSEIIPVLVEAIKEQQQIIEKLELRVKELENKK